MRRCWCWRPGAIGASEGRPAVVCGLLAIAMGRDKYTYLGVVFAALAVVALVMGA